MKWAGGGFLSTVGDLLQFGNAMLYSFQFEGMVIKVTFERKDNQNKLFFWVNRNLSLEKENFNAKNSMISYSTDTFINR